MDDRILDIAERIRGLRDILNIPAGEMAEMLEISEAEYAEYERGEHDFTFTFLFKVAHRFGIDMTDLLTGRSPQLADFTVVRKGEGISVHRRKGFLYESLAYQFKDRIAEPFLVVAKFDEAAASGVITLNSHDGQEFDYILSGTLRVSVDGHETVLGEGDTIYYNSSLRHGMAAVGGDCTFMAVIMNSRRNG
ncbi:MAG: helix-turn-helix domain-containing protein [Saccharofermentanales bacterium]|jgi:transcriptional regulator with XRE-family HTH domain